LKKQIPHKILTILIAIVWILNGLVCKVLNIVPRHEEIVARILGGEHSRLLTILIGIAEIVMAIWILTKFKSKFNAIAQVIVIATMNIMELVLVPDLLLWGKFNSMFALFFIVVIIFNEFVLNRNRIVS
jgi:hypothetical protein